MSRLFDHLRSRLAGVFTLAPEADSAPCDTRGITVTAYLPDEESAIEAVFAIRRHHNISAASAHRIESAEELALSGGHSWCLAMTFYVEAGDLLKLQTETGEIIAAHGGKLLISSAIPESGRQAA